ncbi:ABC transporter ATP-binding protein [Bdellovibrio sp. HCB185ZH]|uniref:ABC transporter ATP-binding protein n=1 Tax=Bdellovibrio sp. HCB185ZH TaxID=3394235 RepID=UPI0039A71FC4
MNPVIQLQSVTKKFTYWQNRPRDLKRYLVNLFSRQKLGVVQQHVTVLSDISFEIFPGEFVGIMGRNGAGKSTTLKIISGIYSPTHGEVKINGKIAPVLELGAGFADELSGFENIFLNAAILGFGRKETEEKISSIIEFSELGDHIQAPVRNYSSGMLVRLAFSIACHLDAPILLFDEILAVGDIGFQRKSLMKIEELHKQGKTIILVTHSPEQVSSYCNRCILIDKHSVAFDGDAKEGAKRYLEEFN